MITHRRRDGIDAPSTAGDKRLGGPRAASVFEGGGRRRSAFPNCWHSPSDRAANPKINGPLMRDRLITAGFLCLEDLANPIVLEQVKLSADEIAEIRRVLDWNGIAPRWTEGA